MLSNSVFNEAVHEPSLAHASSSQRQHHGHMVDLYLCDNDGLYWSCSNTQYLSMPAKSLHAVHVKDIDDVMRQHIALVHAL